ncbi:hypothetical protein C8T65DRAFT_700087 [Cerioporus squamosus]|nr:hypothetical protein C8T65DRAFT_700087 [Cerioporus squamosus]
MSSFSSSDLNSGSSLSGTLIGVFVALAVLVLICAIIGIIKRSTASGDSATLPSYRANTSSGLRYSGMEVRIPLILGKFDPFTKSSNQMHTNAVNNMTMINNMNMMNANAAAATSQPPPPSCPPPAYSGPSC